MDHKRGDSFDWKATVPSPFPNGHFTDWTAASQVRNQRTGALVADLSVSWQDELTTRELRLFAHDTSSWPLGTLQIDIQFTRNSDGYVLSTDTVAFDLVPDVTRT